MTRKRRRLIFVLAGLGLARRGGGDRTERIEATI